MLFFFHSGEDWIQVRNVGDPNPFILRADYIHIPNERTPGKIQFTEDTQLQWMHDGNPIPDANESVLNFDIVDAEQSGEYRLRAVYQDHIFESYPTTLYVNPEKELDPPVLVEIPKDISLMEGHRQSLQVKAVGRNLIYQWKRNGEMILEGPSAELDIFQMDGTWEGEYTVTVSNAFGSVTTDPFQVSLVYKLEFYSAYFPVVHTSSSEEQDFFLSREVSAHDLISIFKQDQKVYSHQFSEGQFGRTAGYSKTPTTMADSGHYTATIHREDNVASMAFETNVQAKIHPSNFKQVNEGQPLILSFYHGLDDKKAHIQWKFNGKPIAGQTSSELRFPVTDSSHQGYYFAEVHYENNIYRTEARHISVFALADLPGIPQLVGVEIDDNGWNRVFWEEIERADSYVVDRTLDDGLSWVGIGSTSDLSLIDPVLHGEGRVGYRLFAKNSHGVSISSQTVWANRGDGNSNSINISGRVYFNGRNERPIPNAIVVLTQEGSEFQTATDAQGKYHFEVSSGKPIKIAVDLSNFSFANKGVDVADLLHLRKHILNRQLLTTSEGRIASDVNRDGLIDVSDIVQIRKVILDRDNAFSRGEQGAKHPIWRLVTPGFAAVAPENAFRDVGYYERYHFDGKVIEITGADFVAIKLGDSNGDWILEGIENPD